MLVAQWAGMARLRYLAPLASAGLAVYVLFAPEQGLLHERKQLGRRFGVIERTSAAGKGLPHYYDIYSPCSGYYWYLRYRNVVPQIVAKPPAAEAGSHVYITADHLRHCWTALAHKADVEVALTRPDATGWPRLDVRVKDPLAMRECTICASDYGCMYLPMPDLSYPLRFPTAGRKAVRVRCTTLDGQRIERRVEFDAQ
jgi:hypothetical protein